MQKNRRYLINYDLTNREGTWGDASQLALDGIGLFPVVGLLNGDEMGMLIKVSNKLGDLTASVNWKGFSKGKLSTY